MKKVNLKKILVIDVESTCWEEKEKESPNEIIQIGICQLDISNPKEFGFTTGNIYVKPIRSKVEDFCRKLTGITQELLDKEAISFRQATSKLMDEYGSGTLTWASFGDYDRAMFRKMCDFHTMTSGFMAIYPFTQRHINVKNLCALKFRWERERGMAAVLNYLKLPLEGTHHNGKDDAKNTAVILSKVLW